LPQADPGFCNSYFQLLLSELVNMDRTATQRIIVVAFSSLLESPLESLPPAVVSNLQGIFAQVNGIIFITFAYMYLIQYNFLGHQ